MRSISIWRWINCSSSKVLQRPRSLSSNLPGEGKLWRWTIRGPFSFFFLISFSWPTWRNLLVVSKILKRIEFVLSVFKKQNDLRLQMASQLCWGWVTKTICSSSSSSVTFQTPFEAHQSKKFAHLFFLLSKDSYKCIPLTRAFERWPESTNTLSGSSEGRRLWRQALISRLRRRRCPSLPPPW